MSLIAAMMVGAFTGAIVAIVMSHLNDVEADREYLQALLKDKNEEKRKI